MASIHKEKRTLLEDRLRSWFLRRLKDVIAGDCEYQTGCVMDLPEDCLLHWTGYLTFGYTGRYEPNPASAEWKDDDFKFLCNHVALTNWLTYMNTDLNAVRGGFHKCGVVGDAFLTFDAFVIVSFRVTEDTKEPCNLKYVQHSFV